MAQLTRQNTLVMQQFTDNTRVLQQQAAQQQQLVQHQNATQLVAMSERLELFMDGSNKALEAGILAQGKASEQLLNQISEAWQKGERERARQLEQLLVKQQALTQACSASSVAVSREPRTEQLAAVLTALHETPPYRDC